MINLSEQPVLSDALTMAKVFRHMNKATSIIKKEMGGDPTDHERLKLLKAEAITRAVSESDNPKTVLNSLYELSSRKARTDDNIAVYCNYHSYSAKSSHRLQLRRYSSLVLYYAWCEGDFIFPVNFRMMRAVTPEMRAESPSAVLRELANYKPTEVEEKKFGIHIEQWLTQYSLSWIYCTNWRSFSDVDDSDASQLHVFMSNYNRHKKGNPSSVERAIKVFADRGYLAHDINEYEDAKKNAYHSAAIKQSKLEVLDPFMAPKRRSGNSCFYLHPQLDLEGFGLSKEAIEIWDKLFDGYILHREQTGRTANERRKGALNVLADYIAIMLPAYAMNSTENIDMPVTPRKFTRYPFVDQTYRPTFFPTFLEYLRKRGLADNSRQSLLYTIQDFFEWVEMNAASGKFADVAGPSFRCPIHRKDFPFVPRPSGTTKVPFTKEIYPLVFIFLYEVERIGMYLEANPKIAMKICKFTAQASNHIIDLRGLEIDFSITYHDDTFKITQIPQRLVVGYKRATQGINLGALRLLTFMMETGKRGQSCQWLDLDSWAKHLGDFSDSDPIKLIHVNTDKTGKTKDIKVLDRVVKMLERQRDHRKSKSIPEIVIDYEKRKVSPFEPLVPLFSKEDGLQFSDSAYSRVWVDILFTIQGFLQQNGYFAKPLAYVKPPKNFYHGSSRVDGSAICKLNWKAVHTPHAARASFVTRRSGSTDYVILAELIGHDDPVSTAYYDVPNFEDIVDVLDRNDRPPLDAVSSVGELRRQLTNSDEERAQIVNQFGISSLQDFHELENGSEYFQGIDLLKSSQASELVFRDTHICPTGEVCPDDVILSSGGAMRCGVCKLACKSVDHLPAIEAKCRALIARIQVTSTSLVREKGGARDQARMGRLHGNLTSDSYQLVGWQDASITLRRLLKENNADRVLVGSPEIIKRHLKRVVRQVQPAQFLIDRIVDAKMYPSVTDEVLRRQASRMARKLAMSEQKLFADENEEVMALYSLIKSRLKALGKTWDEAGELLEQEVGSLIDNASSGGRLLSGGT